ncbi:MAG: nucleotidyl transferase AbiEii/AbiGii toxin family protein [Bacillota bacterium]
MNKDKLINRLHHLSKQKNVNFNVLLQAYFFERFLHRISISNTKEVLILKGGFLLTLMLGIESRSTLDLDFNVNNFTMEKEKINKLLNRITSIVSNDNITFITQRVSDIMQFDIYNGYQVSIIGQLDNIRLPFTLDMATGDPVTPNIIEYNFKSMYDDKMLSIKAYNIETVLAEKLETIIDKQVGNSRMKDFYDIYMFVKLNNHMYDRKVLKEAIKTTFEYRNTYLSKEKVNLLFHQLQTDKEYVKRWNIFVKKNNYVVDVLFEEVISTIQDLLENIYHSSI